MAGTIEMTEWDSCSFTDVRTHGTGCPRCEEGVMESTDRFFVEIRGVSTSDFPQWEADPAKQDEVHSLANDTHDLVREEYGKGDVTGVVPVVNLEHHDLLSSKQE